MTFYLIIDFVCHNLNFLIHNYDFPKHDFPPLYVAEICFHKENLYLLRKKKKLLRVLPKWLPSELTCLNRDFGIHIASPTVAVDHVAINCQLSLKMNDFRSLQIAVCVDAP